jgi:hypothetical protein
MEESEILWICVCCESESFAQVKQHEQGPNKGVSPCAKDVCQSWKSTIAFSKRQRLLRVVASSLSRMNCTFRWLP